MSKKLRNGVIIMLVSAFILSACAGMSGDPSSSTTEDTQAVSGDVTETTAEETTAEPEETYPEFVPEPMTDKEKTETEELKAKNAAFDSSLFGDLSILSQFNTSKYGEPEIAPVKGEHPRMMFKAKDVPALRAKLSKLSQKKLVKSYQTISAKSNITTGVASDGNANTSALMSIEAMAFRYVMEEKEIYAQRALYAVKNSILQIKVTWGDAHRYYGEVMQAASAVYDWCYDALTEKDRQDLLCGMLNLLAKKFEIGCPPAKQSVIAHHNCEDQLLRNYVAMSIAVYDEAPMIYNYVFGRLVSEYKPAADFLLQSGTHWEGAQYGCMRAACLLWAQMLLNNLSDGQYKLFNEEDLHRTLLSYAWIKLPSAKDPFFDVGDIWGTESTGHMSMMAALGGVYFGDANLLALAWLTDKIGINGELAPLCDYVWVSPVMFIIEYNEKKDTIKTGYGQGLPLANIIQYPKSAIYARTDWTAKDTCAVYMTMNEVFTCSHSHMEAGSFQIYYKGFLASDSGSYDAYGSQNHFGYTYQTVASNSVLIFNPNLKIGFARYSGGQSIRNNTRQGAPFTLENLKASPANWQATVFGKVVSADTEKYNYSYLGGDMTGAYDKETAEEVTRHLISVMTDEKKTPMIFVTFDRITSTDASFKKTVLLHSHSAPKTEGDFTVIDNGQGKLVSQILFTDVSTTMYGLDIKKAEDATKLNAQTAYEVDGRYLNPTTTKGVRGIDYRTDFCPTEANKTDRIVNVMYVADSGVKENIKAVELSSGELMGTFILKKAILFPKDENSFAGSSTVTLPDGTNQCFIGGLKAGNWNVTSGGSTKTFTVNEGEALLVFDTTGGNVTVSYAG